MFGEAWSTKEQVPKQDKNLDAGQVEKSVSALELFEGGVRIEINGHKLEIFGEAKQFVLPPRGRNELRFVGTTGTIDGAELSETDLHNVLHKFGSYIISKGGDQMNETLRRHELEKKRQNELTEQNRSAIGEVLG